MIPLDIRAEKRYEADIPEEEEKQCRLPELFKHTTGIEEEYKANKACLRNAAIFKECSAKFVEVLADQVSHKMFQPGEDIMVEGELGDSMYILSRGEVEIIVGGTCVTVLDDGAIFGEMAAMCKNPAAGKRTATVRAKTLCDCRVTYRHVLLQTLSLFKADAAMMEAEVERRLDDLRAKGKLPPIKTHDFQKPGEFQMRHGSVMEGHVEKSTAARLASFVADKRLSQMPAGSSGQLAAQLSKLQLPFRILRKGTSSQSLSERSVSSVSDNEALKDDRENEQRPCPALDFEVTKTAPSQTNSEAKQDVHDTRFKSEDLVAALSWPRLDIQNISPQDQEGSHPAEEAELKHREFDSSAVAEVRTPLSPRSPRSPRLQVLKTHPLGRSDSSGPVTKEGLAMAEAGALRVSSKTAVARGVAPSMDLEVFQKSFTERLNRPTMCARARRIPCIADTPKRGPGKLAVWQDAFHPNSGSPEPMPSLWRDFTRARGQLKDSELAC